MILRTDIYEQDDQLIIIIEVPGIDESMLEVSLDRHVLTIAGRRRLAMQAHGCAYHRRERPVGSFRRDISLPICIGDHQARFIDAKLRDGLYVVRIPLSEKTAQVS
jgi:HSP20 family protein